MKRARKREVYKKASGSKEKPKDHDSGVSVKQDHVRHGKVFHYGGTLGSPFGRAGNAVVAEADLTDTDVPDDEDFLMDWDERSEIEKGSDQRRLGHMIRVVESPRGHNHPNGTEQSSEDMGGNH